MGIEKAGYTGKVKIGMDVAASEFYTEDKMYDLDFKTEGDLKDATQKITGEALTEMYKTFTEKYPVISIEDPFDQDDFPAYGHMTTLMGEKCQIVGEDLLCDRIYRSRQHGQGCGLGRHDFAPVWRDGRLLHRRFSRWPGNGTDQDRCAMPLGATRKVQPAAAYRGRARRYWRLHRR